MSYENKSVLIMLNRRARNRKTFNHKMVKNKEALVNPPPVDRGAVPQTVSISKAAEESLKFSLTEYTKIKEENVESIGSMHTTLNYGLAGMALLFGAIG